MLGVDEPNDADCLLEAAENMEIDDKLPTYAIRSSNDGELYDVNILSIGNFRNEQIYYAESYNFENKGFATLDSLVNLSDKIRLIEEIENFICKDDWKY